MPVLTVHHAVHGEVVLGTGLLHRIGLEARCGTFDPIEAQIFELFHLLFVRGSTELNRFLDLPAKGRVLGEGKIREGKGAGGGGKKLSTVHPCITELEKEFVNSVT